MSYFEQLLENEEIVRSIELKNDQFFLDNVLFSKFNKSDIFKNLWKNRLDNDDKQMIWSWIDSFMKMTKNYASLKK